jgi:hypothetical protein
VQDELTTTAAKAALGLLDTLKAVGPSWLASDSKEALSADHEVKAVVVPTATEGQ